MKQPNQALEEAQWKYFKTDRKSLKLIQVIQVNNMVVAEQILIKCNSRFVSDNNVNYYL